MTRRALIGVVAVASTLGAGLARAQPAGVTRPPTEAGMSDRQLGAALFAANCASCHGARGQGVGTLAQRVPGGVTGRGPNLRGVGAQAADFYLRTGRMPLGDPADVPERQRPPFTPRERRALVQFVASLAPGPPIPRPDQAAGDLAEGQTLFAEHCAGCHQIVAEGGYVTGARVPPLKDSSAVEIAEAVRIGPYLMPKFSSRQITDAQLNSIIRYVRSVRQPEDRGGWGIGHIGPIPEGMVTWLLAAVVLVATCLVIGNRLRS